jgi:rod shape-determining protein MreD
MARFLFGLLIVSMAFVQATILPEINPFRVSVDVIPILLFLWCANHGTRESLVWIFFTGLLLDVLSLDFFGTNALALVVVVLLAGLVHQRVLQANVLVPMVLGGFAVLLHGIALGLLRGHLPTPFPLLVQVAVSVALVPVIYLVLRVFRR